MLIEQLTIVNKSYNLLVHASLELILEPSKYHPKSTTKVQNIKDRAYSNERVTTLPYSGYNITTNTEGNVLTSMPMSLVYHCPNTKYGCHLITMI